MSVTGAEVEGNVVPARRAMTASRRDDEHAPAHLVTRFLVEHAVALTDEPVHVVLPLEERPSTRFAESRPQQ
jgi:hypothetical protein